MSKAFVVEWSPLGLYSPMIGRVYYSRGCRGDVDDPRRNYCDFSFNARGAMYTGSYLVNSAYEAKVLTRLLKRVSNFQIYCATEKYKNQDQLCNFKEAIKSLFDEQSCYTGWPYIFNYPESQNIRENIDISEIDIDTKQPLKLGPCFFYDQYEMHDENGHPLYMSVAIERKNDGTEDADLFNYKVKFIGSGQSLPKNWKDVPLYDDTELYRQKVAKYKREHAAEYENYANKIWAAITDPDYKKKFETYTYEESSEWRTCYPVMGGFSCSDYYYWKYGYCYEKHCPHWRGWTHNMATHDGKAFYNNFEHVFGSEFAQLAKNGALKDQHKSLMPDFSDPEFIRKFNKYKVGSTLHFFDDNGNIQNRQMHLNGTLGYIKYWAHHPDFDVLRFVDCGEVHTISSLNTKTEQIEPEVTEDPAIFPTDLKTRLLWSDMGRVEFPTIYMKSPGCTRIVESDLGAAYDYVNEDEHIYYDYTDTYVVYAKPKSKGKKETTYYFPHPWNRLGYNLEYLMCDVHDIQTHDSNLKWAPSKLFPEDKERIEVMRANVDYNGIMVLNPKKMSPIKCEYYEIRPSLYDTVVHAQTGARIYCNNIFLFDQKGQVSGIIHTWHVDKIIPHIIARNMVPQK